MTDSAVQSVNSAPSRTAWWWLWRTRSNVCPIEELRAKCEELAETEPGDTRKLSSLLQQMSLNYYEAVRRQAQQSFYCALGAAGIGTLFFLGAIIFMQAEGRALSIVAGALVEVIAGINFYLYARAARQFASFHICLERTNRFLLANSLCENLVAGDEKERVRAELVRTVADAPMLTLDVVTGEFTPRAGDASKSVEPRRAIQLNAPVVGLPDEGRVAEKP